MDVGVLGVGAMGRNHVRVYSELKGVDTVYVYDPVQENAQRASEPFTPDADSALPCTPAKTFSNTRGTAGKIVGFVSARLATTFSTDSAKIIVKPS